VDRSRLPGYVRRGGLSWLLLTVGYGILYTSLASTYDGCSDDTSIISISQCQWSIQACVLLSMRRVIKVAVKPWSGIV
jgi:hypothetical protein